MYSATIDQRVAITTISTTNLRQATTISTIDQDIIENQILTRLDCVTLASLSSTSSYFRSLSSQETIWRDICLSKWPSVSDQRVIQLISSFPNGYRGFFSACYPLVVGSYKHPKFLMCPSLPSELISTIDVWYQNRPIFSRVIQTETWSEWFKHSPFRVDLLDPKEVFPTTMKIIDWDDDLWQQELEQNLTLSWIIIDSTHKRAANFSSLRPVSVQRHWLTGEVQMEYATVLAGPQVGFVACKVVLICGCRREQGESYVREVCMQMENVDGKYLNGKDSLVTLANAMELGKRSRGENGEGRKRHQDFMEMVRQRNERKMLKERMLDMVCVAGISIFLTFSTLYLVGRW